MKRGLPVAVCLECGHCFFPPRPLCPRCGGGGWREQLIEGGVVEERTAQRYREEHVEVTLVGRPDEWGLVRIASVRTDAGQVVIAWSPEDAPPGSAVKLETQQGVPIARLPEIGEHPA